MRQPDVGRAHAVDADVVRAAAGAVDVEHERTRGVRRHRVRFGRRRESRQHPEQVLVVAVQRHRKVHQLGLLQLCPHLGPFGLEQRALGRHHHRLRQLTDFERRIDAADRVQRDRHVGAGEGAEPCQLDRHRIGAGLHRREPVGTGRIADGLTRGVGLVVRDGDGRTRYRGAALVGDRADEGAVQHLRAPRCRRGEDLQYDQGCHGSEPGSTPWREQEHEAQTKPLHGTISSLHAASVTSAPPRQVP